MKARTDPAAARNRRLLETTARQKTNGNGTHPGDLWKNLAQTSPSSGAMIPNLWNALLALRNDPHWAGRFAWDQMTHVQIGPNGPIEDVDIIPIHEWMQFNGMPRIGLDVVREAIEGVAHEHPVHPLRDELRQCHTAWDGQNRIAEWTQTYLGSHPGEPNNTIGTMFLVAMIARVFEPGCKADYMLVLEGPQGAKKSQACEILAGNYFSDELPDLASDPIRVSMHLRGKWLIEVAELSSFSKPDAAKLKSFLSARVEQYIPKFARYEVRQPRQCLFVGTTNEDTYLRDATGGRRFWPLKCGNIDLDALRRDRNLLLGEAVDLYRLHTKWWPDTLFEDTYLKPLQESRYEGDAWEDTIERELVGRSKVTSGEIARDFLKIPEGQIGTLTTRRIAAILKSFGWQQKHVNKSRFWVNGL